MHSKTTALGWMSLGFAGLLAAAQAQGTDPMTQTGQRIQACMQELGAQASQNQVFACVRRKTDEARPKTPEERAQRAQELRDQMARDAEQSRLRQQNERQAADMRMNEVRAGQYGPQMQVAALCRDELQQRGVKPEMPQWTRAIQDCVARTPARPGATAPSPAVGSEAWCVLETRKKRIRGGDFGDAEGRAMADKKPGATAVSIDTEYCANLSGARGPDVQVGSVCASELQDLYITPAGPGLGEFNALLERCERKGLRELRSASGQAAGEQPFGDSTRVHDYLNALYTDDLVTVRSVDLAHGLRLQMRGSVTLFREVLRNYFANYRSFYGACLEPDAPTVTVGEVYDEVTRDGTGMEVRRNRVDTRVQVPVNRRFIDLARATGVTGGNRLQDGIVLGLAGVNLRDLAPARVNEALRSAMALHRCDSEVVRRLEQKFLQHAPALMGR